jgi:hypothetical protein
MCSAFECGTPGRWQQANCDPLVGQKRLDIEFLAADKFLRETAFGLGECVVHQRLRECERTEDVNFCRREAN